MTTIEQTVTEQLRQLHWFTHRAMLNRYAGRNRAYNPHRGQGRVLAILKLKPEIGQKELTFLLGMSKQSLAELLVKLEKQGYITREQSETDRRAVTIKLTDEGMAASEKVGERSTKTSEFIEDLSEEELGIFSGYLARILKRYEEKFPEEDFDERRRTMKKFMAQHARGRRSWERGSDGFAACGDGSGPRGFAACGGSGPEGFAESSGPEGFAEDAGDRRGFAEGGSACGGFAGRDERGRDPRDFERRGKIPSNPFGYGKRFANVNVHVWQAKDRF